MLWRRSYDAPPPPLADDDQCPRSATRRYADLPDELLPRTECLKDVVERMLPYWYDGIVPDLRTGRTVLVAAHGNSLRALVKHLDGISDDDIAGPEHPDRHPAALPARRRPAADRRAAASTSTPTPPRRRSRRSRTRAAEGRSQPGARPASPGVRHRGVRRPTWSLGRGRAAATAESAPFCRIGYLDGRFPAHPGIQCVPDRSRVEPNRRSARIGYVDGRLSLRPGIRCAEDVAERRRNRSSHRIGYLRVDLPGPLGPALRPTRSGPAAAGPSRGTRRGGRPPPRGRRTARSSGTPA